MFDKKDPNLPFFVAEISANHLGNISNAHNLIKAAAEAGADAVKFQTYTADTMTLDLDSLSVSNDHELWGGKRLYELYSEAQTPWEWHAELFQHARELGLIPFSSPFDISALQFLENLNCSIYKIASLESGDLELIRDVGMTGKPTIISTGATELEEIDDAVSTFLGTGNQNLTLLVCTSSYPAKPSESHLNRIHTLRERYSLNIGVSDHTLGIGVSIAAIALGATVVEKHITLSRNVGGLDSAFSMEPNEFKQLIQEGKNAKLGLGKSEWQILKSETESRRLRRSLYVVKDVAKNEMVSIDNIRAIRPGYGVKPKYLSFFLSKKFKNSFKAGTPLDFNMVD